MSKNNEIHSLKAYIALVEDDDTIRELLTLNLQNAGFDVDSFFSIEQLERKTKAAEYDLLILDIMLPGMNGLNYAKKLREESQNVPILFISALGQEDKIRMAYEAGAIDYIVKPFEIEHLLLKIRNLLFLFIRRASAPLPSKVGMATIDWELMQVNKEDSTHILTPKEAKILIYFFENPNKVISRQELMDNVWGENVYVTSRNIDNFLVKFRKWFEKDPANPVLFITYPKKGYAFKKN
ncbi:MAG: response regulator transcription factor [Leptospirales bacterium]